MRYNNREEVVGMVWIALVLQAAAVLMQLIQLALELRKRNEDDDEK